MKSPLAPLLLAAAALLPCPLWAEPDRPTAMELLPAETVLLVRSADAALFLERLNQTSGARLLCDPSMAGVVESFATGLTEAYQDTLREALQTDLSDLQRLPQGEIAFALVERKKTSPAVTLLADFGDSVEVAEQVVARLKTLAAENDRIVAIEQLRNDEATLIRRGNNQNRVLGFVRRGSTFVVASDRALLQSMLDRWDGVPVETPLDAANAPSDADEAEEPAFAVALADHPTFGAAMRPCLPGRDEPPQAILYADPIGILRATAGRQTPVRLALAIFPALGVDGVKAIAGATWMATDKWDSLVRAHLLLDNPRAGVLKIARLETGDTTPPPFVPVDLENFVVLHADPQRLYADIIAIVDRFQYEGAFRKLVDDSLSQKVGVDFETDFIDNLAGHAYLCTGYDDQQRDISGRGAIAVRVKDTEQAAAMLGAIAEKFPEQMHREAIGATEYFVVGPKQAEADAEAASANSDPRRPAVGLIGDTLLLASTQAFFTRFVGAHDGVDDRFVDSLQYRLTTGRLGRMSGGQPPSVAAFHDDGPTYRHWHAVLSRDASRAWLNDQAENNPLLRAVRNTLEENELPPAETLMQYNAPGGTVVYDTPTGFQLISFSFRR